MSDVVDVWAVVLEAENYENVASALKAYILSDRTGFAPSIGQLRALYATIAAPTLPEGEAWAMVRRAIGRASRFALEDFNAFPPAVRSAVGDAFQLKAWGLSEDFNEAVVQSQFLRAYRQAAEREQREAAIGAPFLAQIAEKRKQEVLTCIT